MIKKIEMSIVTMLTSMYFFPFEFSFLPGVNTKMMLAGIGLILLLLNLAHGRMLGNLNGDLIRLSVVAMVISLISFASITINGTYDNTFVYFVVSMWVWLGGAYLVTRLMKALHGYLNVELVCNYLVAVCVGQCVVAFSMEQIPALKSLVDSFLGSSGLMGKVEGRIYGIGASLDVAGMRFASVLLIIAFLSINAKVVEWRKEICYVASFFIVVSIGCMIGRTTTIGAVIALIYWGITLLMGKGEQRRQCRRIFFILGAMLVAFTPVVVYFYKTNPSLNYNIRFAFEGFFSLVEKGRWETHSTNILRNMYVFPNSVKTWLIGDGYFDNPEIDPHYIGYRWKGFYQGTDVGYLRFIFYAGIGCAVAFVIYMFNVAYVCMLRFKGYALLFFGILVLNYIVWFKVSSDLFPVFAAFLCITSNDIIEADVIGSKRMALNQS